MFESVSKDMDSFSFFQYLLLYKRPFFPILV